MDRLPSRFPVAVMLVLAGALAMVTGCAGAGLHNRTDASQQLLGSASSDGRGASALARRDASIGRVDRSLGLDDNVTMPATDGGNGTCGPQQEPSPLPIAGPTQPGR
ncbi:MAG: hypothetical protein KGO50_02015 [Myxococcales bacterium]|nr:hypothetical protein [Myxococcales bacterium]